MVVGNSNGGANELLLNSGDGTFVAASAFPGGSNTSTPSRSATSTAMETSTWSSATAGAAPTSCCSTAATGRSWRRAPSRAAARDSRRRARRRRRRWRPRHGRRQRRRQRAAAQQRRRDVRGGERLPGGSAYTRAVALGDVDGDGDLDMVVGNGSGGANELLLNSGDGTFVAASAFPGGSADTYAVALGDVDGDGDLDMVVGNNWGGSNELLLNSGDGTFVAASAFPGGSEYTYAVALGDVDGDGDLDMVVGNNFDMVVGNYGANELLLNSGDGTFVAASAFPGGSAYTNAVALGDVDGDGDLDMVVGNNWGGSNELLRYVICTGARSALAPYGLACIECPTLMSRCADDNDICYECEAQTQLDLFGECSACTRG